MMRCRACRGTASSPDCHTADALRISRSAGAGRLPDVTRAPFQQIVEQHGATVLRVCRAVIGPDDAQDAWSETFLSALRAYPDLDAGANVQAWLVTIAHRKAIDITRARARRRSRSARSRSGSRRSACRRPGRHELWADVAALPDRQRMAIAYHYLAGLPYAEVAQILGGTPDAARRAAADGIKALRRRLSNHGAKDE